MKYTKPNGKEGTLIIGDYPIVTLSVARRKRDEAKTLLLDNLDPMEEKKKAKIVAQRAALLFETVALQWHADMSRRWTERHAKTVMSRLGTHVFPLITAVSSWWPLTLVVEREHGIRYGSVPGERPDRIAHHTPTPPASGEGYPSSNR